MQQQAENESPTITPPSGMRCVITQKIMREPVMNCFGHSFERTAIEKWYETHDTCPLSHQTVTNKTLTSNFALKSIIDDFLIKYPSFKSEVFEEDLVESLIKAIAAKNAQLVSNLVMQNIDNEKISQLNPREIFQLFNEVHKHVHDPAIDNIYICLLEIFPNQARSYLIANSAYNGIYSNFLTAAWKSTNQVLKNMVAKLGEDIKKALTDRNNDHTPTALMLILLRGDLELIKLCLDKLSVADLKIELNRKAYIQLGYMSMFEMIACSPNDVAILNMISERDNTLLNPFMVASIKSKFPDLPRYDMNRIPLVTDVRPEPTVNIPPSISSTATNPSNSNLATPRSLISTDTNDSFVNTHSNLQNYENLTSRLSQFMDNYLNHSSTYARLNPVTHSTSTTSTTVTQPNSLRTLLNHTGVITEDLSGPHVFSTTLSNQATIPSQTTTTHSSPNYSAPTPYQAFLNSRLPAPFFTLPPSALHPAPSNFLTSLQNSSRQQSHNLDDSQERHSSSSSLHHNYTSSNHRNSSSTNHHNSTNSSSGNNRYQPYDYSSSRRNRR